MNQSNRMHRGGPSSAGSAQEKKTRAGLFSCMVRRTGLEPARVSPLAPQASASANSAISARQTELLLLKPRARVLPPDWRGARNAATPSSLTRFLPVPPHSMHDLAANGFETGGSGTVPPGGGTYHTEGRESFQFACAKAAYCSTMWGSRNCLGDESADSSDARSARIHERFGVRPAAFRLNRRAMLPI